MVQEIHNSFTIFHNSSRSLFYQNNLDYRRTSLRTAAMSVSISSNFGSAIPFFSIPSSVAMIWIWGVRQRLFSFFAAHRSPHPSITTSFPPLITASISRVDCFACRCPSKEIRVFLRKDSRDLCRQFPGIGNTRAGDEDQWTIVSNFSHPDSKDRIIIQRSSSFYRLYLHTLHRFRDLCVFIFRKGQGLKTCFYKGICHCQPERYGCLFEYLNIGKMCLSDQDQDRHLSGSHPQCSWHMLPPKYALTRELTGQDNI